MDKNEVVLEVKNLSIDIPVSQGVLHAVDKVNLHVDRGEILCVVGESGCGKSLTSLAIMGLLPKNAQRSAETLELKQEDLQKLTERQLSDIRGNRMAMIFQEPMTSLNPYHKVGNQITESILSHEDISKKDAEKKAKELMQLVEIPDLERRYKSYPHELSGGQRQRIMIAMSLINEPELLIADEPTTALDVTIQAQILDLMNRLKDKLGMSILFITHDLGLVEKFSDRVCVMKEGKIVEQGITTEIFANPKHEYTIKLLKSEPKEKDQLHVSDDNILDISNPVSYTHLTLPTNREV